MIFILLYLIIRDYIYRKYYIYPYINSSGKLSTVIEEDVIINYVKDKLLSPPKIAFVGNSHVLDAINPSIISKITQKTSFNFAHYYLPFSNSLKILIDANCYPEIIFVDVSTRYSMFSTYYDKKNYVSNRSNIKSIIFQKIDKISYLFPSLFMPIRYYNFLFRGLKKIIYTLKNRKITFSRYSPFSRLISYRWSLDKDYNHRIVDTIREKTKIEKLVETIYLRNSINETLILCDKKNKMYIKSMQILNQFLIKATENSSNVVFMRLPLDPRLIEFENINCNYFFEDLKKQVKNFNYTFLDLNESFGYKNPLDFYSDGQHLTESSSELVSIFLANYINTKL
jgi:hypothetical protein